MESRGSLYACVNQKSVFLLVFYLYLYLSICLSVSLINTSDLMPVTWNFLICVLHKSPQTIAPKLNLAHHDPFTHPSSLSQVFQNSFSHFMESLPFTPRTSNLFIYIYPLGRLILSLTVHVNKPPQSSTFFHLHHFTLQFIYRDYYSLVFLLPIIYFLLL